VLSAKPADEGATWVSERRERGGDRARERERGKVAKMDVYYTICPFKTTAGRKVDWKRLKVREIFGQNSCQIIRDQL
jgi:hypothetical protein